MRRTTQVALGLLIVAAVALGALYVFRDRLVGDAGALQVGDCIEVPDSATDIAEIEHRPCSEDHEAEVFHIVDYPAQASYPSEGELEAFFGRECLDAPFVTYTGITIEDAADIDAAYFPPAVSAWDQGRRLFVCYLLPAGGGVVDHSYRKR
jgi:hypothetical protein